jgi:hypothetical protein
MKKTMLLLMLSLVMMGWGTERDLKMTIRLGAGGLFGADEGYREIYGDLVLLPHVKFACRLTGAFGLWAGYAGLSKKGQSPISGILVSSSQHYLSAGGAYIMALSERVELTLAAGPLMAFYREEAGRYLEQGSRLGADVHSIVSWSLSRSLALDLNLGFLFASGENDYGDAFRLGGLWGGLGLAFHF